MLLSALAIVLIGLLLSTVFVLIFIKSVLQLLVSSSVKIYRYIIGMFTTEKRVNFSDNSNQVIISREDFEKLTDIAAGKLSKYTENLKCGQFNQVETGQLHGPGY